jgi:O-antigen ligase/polysaccharide polymerase Wzy-like membrane protein
MNDATAPTVQIVAMPTRTGSSIRTLPLWVGGAVLLALPTFLAFRSGGYVTAFGAETQLLVAIGAFAMLTLVALAAPWPIVARGRPLAALATLVAFEAWTFASISWAPLLTTAAEDGARAAMYAAVFALALAATRVRRVRAAAPWVLLGGIVAVALYALGSRFAPQLVPTARLALAGDRLAHPLTYWNALGLLMATGVLLSIVTASGGPRPAATRGVACAAAVPCGVALALTLSRGAYAALGAGLIVLALARPRLLTAMAGALALSGAAVATVVAFALPAVRSLGDSRSAQESQGLAAAIATLALAIVVGLVFAKLCRRVDRPAPRLPRLVRVAVAGGLVATIAAGGTLVATEVERNKPVPGTVARVTTFEAHRSPYWRVAVDAFWNHPVTGVGTGGFNVEWRRERDERQNALDAHSLYIETLAELGIVGFLLLAAFAAVVGGGVIRRLREIPDDPVVAAAAVALAALAFHVGLDWDWEMPAVTLPALILGAAALQPRDALAE